MWPPSWNSSGEPPNWDSDDSSGYVQNCGIVRTSEPTGSFYRPTVDNDEELRRRHVADAVRLAPLLTARLAWSTAQLADHRRHRLRALLRVAIDRSPWHRRRLAAVDPDRFEAAMLVDIPVMTKQDLMAHFDDVVTDRRLTLDAVEHHLARGHPGYLLDHYRAVASGGSTGQRGVFVYDWHGWVLYYLGIFRPLMGPAVAQSGTPTVATVAAAHSAHPTAAVDWTFSGDHLPIAPFPVTLPVRTIVEGLNATQPTVLKGYSSALVALAGEAADGRLAIRPRQVWAGSEPLLPEMRATLEATWGVPVGNVWGTAEGGGLAAPCPAGSTHLNEDLAIIEFVDPRGAPVEAGARAAKVYLTNLTNPFLPLIRYELDDEVTVLPGRCSCGSHHRRIADIHGRNDNVFVYGSIVVHPHVFRSALGRCRNVVDYQVRQTEEGASIVVRARGTTDWMALGAEITAGLGRLGLPHAVVSIDVVDDIERQVSGKLRRFVPLSAAVSGAGHQPRTEP